jgi:hypothetical protein
MIESPIVTEWRAKAYRSGMIEALLLVLEARFTTMPKDAVAQILACSDEDQLRRWTIVAATAATLEQFCREANL